VRGNRRPISLIRWRVSGQKRRGSHNHHGEEKREIGIEEKRTKKREKIL